MDSSSTGTHKFTSEDKGKSVVLCDFTGSCRERMIYWNQSDIDLIKYVVGKLPCFDENFDNLSDNYRYDMT